MEHSKQTQRIVLTTGKTVAFIPALPSQAQTHSLELSYAPLCASLHPILQDRFVTGSTSDQWIRIHGAIEGEEREVLKGHHGPVHCIEYSPDGEVYASGSGEPIGPSMHTNFTDRAFFSISIILIINRGRYATTNICAITIVLINMNRNHSTMANYSGYNIWFMARHN